MRIKINLFRKKLFLNFGLKEPDFISAKEVKEYAKVDELSSRMVNLNKKLKKFSKTYGITEVFVKGLTVEEISILENKGFAVTLKTKVLHDGQIEIVKNNYKVTLK